jgi:UDP-N-acetylmuramate--alanine ligase
VIITDIYTAGEANPTGVTGEVIASHVVLGSPATSAYAATFDDVLTMLEALHDQSDVVLLLGAGDIASVASELRGGLD